MHFFCREEI